MQCHTCRLTPICKIFQALNGAQSIADISVNNCKLYQSLTDSIQSLPTEPQAPTPRPVRNLNTISDSIRELYKENKKAEATELKTCNNCGEEATSISKCSSCGKTVCELCLVNDINGTNVYCESCWDDL